MISRKFINELPNYIGQNVTVCGFVNTVRNQGGIKFILLRDNTGFIQCVVLKSNQIAFELAGNIFNESVLKISGLLKEEKQAPGGFEILAEEIEVLSVSEAELPIPVNQDKIIDDVEVSKRMDYRWLDLRDPEKLKIFKVWTSLEEGFRKVYRDLNFVQIYTPSLVGTATEGGSEVFEVKYFDRKAYLAQSPQFYKQMAMASGFDRVFISNPMFRAEPSFTTRHLTEFTMWDFEISYVDSHHDIMDIEEKLLVSGLTQINHDLNLGIEIPSTPFPRVPFEEGKKILKSRGITSDKEGDFSPEEERELCKYVKETYNSDFVFITDYLYSERPFYSKKHEENPKLSKSFDLLYKGIEITSGAQREHRSDILEKQIAEKGLNVSDFKDYIDFFKYGCPPHGGAGIGPGRIIMQILNLSSVKESSFLPRDVKRLNP
jgi:nondiscriminating aspartyl-tRNA synthetase